MFCTLVVTRGREQQAYRNETTEKSLMKDTTKESHEMLQSVHLSMLNEFPMIFIQYAKMLKRARKLLGASFTDAPTSCSGDVMFKDQVIKFGHSEWLG